MSGEKRLHQEVLTREQFVMFRNFLYQVSGVFLPDHQQFMLDSRIFRRMRELAISSPIEYLCLLKSSSNRELSSELFHFLDALTTHETYFFRNEPQLEGLQRHILPDIFDRQRRSRSYTLKIWSAACSTGEEPYTLAMVIREMLGSEFKRWNVSILGTDISPAVIHKAREGVYPFFALRGIPPYYRQKYFSEKGVKGQEVFTLAPEICSMVHFRVLNFTDALGMGGITGQHIIFCRNTFIYFDAEAKRRFAGYFYESLVEGGYLVIGHTETLHGVDSRFAPVKFQDATAYQKDREFAAKTQERPAPSHNPQGHPDRGKGGRGGTW
jgi:chemotaxis protein methyltransferase CheR